MAKPRTVACPQCGTALEWTEASRFRPFCSERCKLIDFGGWASEAYRVPVAEQSDPDPDADAEPSPPPAGRTRDRR